ncbi:piggyBac transposable element-derived protein 4-like [Schistocerca americana]|uniref:piggyBac transposable element-derived protein 4-like n=1 Tax=Schistocerca americana TaxID=7009 RepID=UPI001F4F256B|nr:piggyBac transposable element-derived protein 4-like [Schistocerca americana]
MQYSAVKWRDNKFVTFLSNFVGENSMTEAEIFDKKLKKSVKVSCPKPVVECNQFIGGVDLVDSVLALYRIQIRSKKWYHRIFFHILDLIIVNAWFLYRRDALSSGMHWKSMLALAEFKKVIGRCLLFQGKSEARKQEKPKSNSIERAYMAKKKKGPTAALPGKDMRLDGIGHLPLMDVKGRCKVPSCNGIVGMKC